MYFYTQLRMHLFSKMFQNCLVWLRIKKQKSKLPHFFLDPYQIILEKCFVGRGLKQMKRFLCSIVQYSTMMKIRYLTTLALTWNRPSIEIIFFFLSLYTQAAYNEAHLIVGAGTNPKILSIFGGIFMWSSYQRPLVFKVLELYLFENSPDFTCTFKKGNLLKMVP